MLRRKLVKILIIIICCIGLLILVEFFPKKTKLVNIPPNIPSEKIASILKEHRLILHPQIFLTFTYLTSSDTKLRSGSYRLSFSITGLPIIYKLRKRVGAIKITIPEGFTTEQIANRLTANGVISDPIKFITYVKSKNLDGYLFPETYYFVPQQEIEQICNQMLKEFKKKVEPLLSRATEVKLTPAEVVILASIVEKEAKSVQEKKLVAGVFLNRLRKGWPLESCATVRYALKKYKEPLTYKDVQVDSVYNTYKYYGLPPTPICNPGIDSIKAVLEPEKTDAMFFFTDNNSTHKFSKFYKEHLKLQKKIK